VPRQSRQSRLQRKTYRTFFRKAVMLGSMGQVLPVRWSDRILNEWGDLLLSEL
jgi:hypothetical protein